MSPSCGSGQQAGGLFLLGLGTAPGPTLPAGTVAGACFTPAAQVPAWAVVVAMAVAWALLAQEKL